MCHGRIAPKSTSTFAVSCVGYGSFFPLVILSTLLGVGHASGESWLPPVCVPRKNTIPGLLPDRTGTVPLDQRQFPGEQRVVDLSHKLKTSVDPWFSHKWVGPHSVGIAVR